MMISKGPMQLQPLDLIGNKGADRTITRHPFQGSADSLLPSLIHHISSVSAAGSVASSLPSSALSAFSSPISTMPDDIKVKSITSPVSSFKPTPGNMAIPTSSHGLLESQLAGHLMDRYGLSDPNRAHQLASLSNSLQQLQAKGEALFTSASNGFLGAQLTTPHFLQSAPSQPLLLPRYSSPVLPQARRLESKGGEESSSRRLRWKEEHGRVLIAIWKEKYPQVRAAKKIKEKHAIWQTIGEEYNKFCVKNDWPARSTEQVKIKVKNCIDEYKQTIKYNQEYKTCPYFQPIDEIFGMSDPEKAAELQKSVSPDKNSDNAYWSGSNLPTQVKKRKLNISCSSVEHAGGRAGATPTTTTGAGHPPPAKGENPQQRSPASVTENSSTNGSSGGEENPPKRPDNRAQEPRYEVKIGIPPTSGSTTKSNGVNHVTIDQLAIVLKQVHEREEKMIETFHRIDIERRNATLLRERERYEAEYQLEKSRQAFLSGVVEKLVSVIKERAHLGSSSSLSDTLLSSLPTTVSPCVIVPPTDHHLHQQAHHRAPSSPPIAEQEEEEEGGRMEQEG